MVHKFKTEEFKKERICDKHVKHFKLRLKCQHKNKCPDENSCEK